MNQIKIDGRLTADPVVNYTQAGKVYTKFTLAVHRKKNGEENTMFIPCVAFGEVAEEIGNNTAKGVKLFVEEGSLSVDEFTRKDGSRGRDASITAWKVQYEAKAAPKPSAFDEMEEIPF